MARLLERIDAKQGRLLWLDGVDYAIALLNAQQAPWRDVAACTAWQRKAQGLLKSDVVHLPLAPLVATWLSSNPTLQAALAARRRPLAPLRALLADEALGAHVAELLRSYRASFADLPFALLLPSPRHWLSLAHEQAFGAAPEAVEDDDVDAAAVQVAAFLRSFGELGVDALLLDERAAPAAAADIELYRPVLNVAAHYRWDTGLLLPEAPAWSAPTAFDFLIAPGELAGQARCGRLVDAAFWDGASAAAAAFHYLRIPAGAQPERVLERLQTLR